MTRSIFLLAISLGLMATLLGCHSKSDSAYVRDIDRICFAEKHAGALEIETSDRSLVVADWLSRNLESDKAREFLGKLATMPAKDKAERLRGESKAAKLKGCPTADAWDKVVSDAAANH